MRAIILALSIALSGCATLSKPEVFTACKLADIVTTKQALGRGAIEANPIMDAIGFNGFALLSLALIWWVWEIHEEAGEEELPVESQAALTGLSVVTCAAAFNNHTQVMR